MAESFDEQLSRVQSMASGSNTWDLSRNDVAALKALLKERTRLVAITEAADEYRAVVIGLKKGKVKAAELRLRKALEDYYYADALARRSTP